MIFSPLFLLSFLLLFLSATATYRGQILFKDTLAQQLCEQGGEYQGCCMHTSLCKHMHNECVGSYRYIFYLSIVLYVTCAPTYMHNVPLSHFLLLSVKLYAYIIKIWQSSWCAASSWLCHCSTSWLSFCLMMQPESEIFGCPMLPA